MKKLITYLTCLALIVAGASVNVNAATVTGRSEDASLAGTEKIPADSSGVDTYILVSELWSAMVLSGGLTASGSTAFDFSGSTGAFKTSTGANTFGGSSHTFASAITPASNDGGALGSASLQWSDLFLASGGVINFGNGDAVVTHSSGVLTVGTGDLRVTTGGTNAASVVTNAGTQSLSNKTIVGAVISTGLTASGSTANDFSASTGTFKTSTGVNTFGGSSHLFAAKAMPSSDDGAALGDTTHHWSDLFLATGAVINYNNGNVAITHSSGILTMGTGELRITTAGTNSASVPTLGSTSTLTNKTLTSPVIGSGLTASGSGSNDFSGSTGAFETSSGVNTFNGSEHSFAGKLYPATDDGAALGDATHNFSDIFLATGAVLNYANGNVAVTHSSGILTMGTGELRVTTPGTNAASVPTLGSTSTLTNKTLTAPVINGVTAASGDFDFSGSSGTFITSTGANTLSGAVTIADATTPSLTTAAGKTNTGYVQINGKTSGALKLIAADAAAQTVTVSLSAQTSGAATLSIGDMAGTAASVMMSALTSNAPNVVNSVWGSSNTLNWEGTADASEISLDAADATADVVYRLPNAAAGTYSVMSSTLATNAPAIANSVTGASNSLIWEGTADTSEITLDAADATADVVYRLPDAAAATYSLMSSTLATNAPDIANSVYGVSAGLMFEGSTADASEAKIQATDPTADTIWVLPVAAAGTYGIMSSSLATNAVDVANSVYGGTNQLILEGATADAFETIITPTDATADRTITTPQASGTMALSQASTTTALTADDQAVVPAHNTVLQLTSDNATATNRTFTLTTTGAITGQIYVLIGPATNQCELADTGSAVLSATWSPTTGDTLTLIYNGTEFIELSRANN